MADSNPTSGSSVSTFLSAFILNGLIFVIFFVLFLLVFLLKRMCWLGVVEEEVHSYLWAKDIHWDYSGRVFVPREGIELTLVGNEQNLFRRKGFHGSCPFSNPLIHISLTILDWYSPEQAMLTLGWILFSSLPSYDDAYLCRRMLHDLPDFVPCRRYFRRTNFVW
jgi:hypothetical protein